jgi:hypothetical protein
LTRPEKRVTWGPTAQLAPAGFFDVRRRTTRWPTT